MQKRNIVIGSLFGLLAALAYTAMATLVKLSYGVNIETLVFFRNVISLLLLFPLLFQKKITLKTKYLNVHIIRSISGMLGLYAYFYALRKLPLVNAILLSNTAPLFIPLIVFLWVRVKVSKRRLMFLTLGFIGVGFILQPRLEFPLIPSIIGVSAGLLIAIAMTSVRLLSKTEHIESILFYFFVFAIFISFFPMVFSWEPFDEFMWIYIGGVGISATLFQYFITKAYSFIPATQAGCLMYLSVIFGGIVGFLLFDTVPNFAIVFGSTLVILGGTLTLIDKSKPMKAK